MRSNIMLSAPRLSNRRTDHASRPGMGHAGAWSAAIALLVGSLTGAAIGAAEPTAEQSEFFEKKVRPVLVERCVECHGEDVQEADLRVDSLAALLQGGTRGPSILPGDAKNSLLIRAIGHGETLQMPPKQKLPADQISDLAEWVRQGAPWPKQPLPPLAAASGKSGKSPLMQFTDEQRSHWALQPVARTMPPEVRSRDWLVSPLDAFVLRKLEDAELRPARPAARHAWLRRVAFNLTGLPPTLDQLNDFLSDDAPDARSRIVDRYLASPRYGERFGRHWLDLARYADSNGLDENLAYANAFRYRDYVIRSLNGDKSFDRFVHEQLAGDLLTHANEASELDGIVATGFLSLGAKMLAEDDPVKMQMDIIDEQVDTIGKVFLGMTLGCARCHDHKYDPVDVHDYYALAGIFKSTRTMVNHNVVAVWQERPIADKATLARREELQRQVDARRGEASRIAAAATDRFLSTQRLRAGEYLWAAHLRSEHEKFLADARPWGQLSAEEQSRIAGLRILEAEDYARGNVSKDMTSYGLGIGVLVNRGELPNFAEYDLEMERAGVYRLELRYAAASSRPCKVLLNGKQVLDAAAGKVTGSWNPDGQQWFVEGVLELPAGRSVLRLEQPQFFPHIDKLLIAPAGADSLRAPHAADESFIQELDEELVRQWTRFLEQTRDDPGSALSVWHAAVARRSVETLVEPAPRRLAERLELSQLGSMDRGYDLRELARRYGDAWRAADEEWRALRETPEGRDAKKLDDVATEALRQVLHDPKGPFAVPKNVEGAFPAEALAQLRSLREAVQQIEKTMPDVPEAMAVSELKPENLRIHFRGSHLTQGEEVTRRFLRILPGGLEAGIAEGRSGRLEMAQWLTRADQPLTPRVLVNRLWLWNFGQAIVRSPDNFGILGEKPTHPELLDWLAAEVVRREWSLKSMERELVLSATYGMSDTWDERADALDPENRLFWRAVRRRLSAEEIRDAILAASGTLDLKMGGTNLPTKNRQYVTSTANVNPAIYDLAYRSVYVPVVRSALYEVFQAFDFADPSVASGQRESTTVAPQALFMLNSKITAQASRSMSEQLLAAPVEDDASRVDLLYRRAVSRAPTADEVARALAFVDRYQALVRGQIGLEGEARTLAWRALSRAVMSANEFVYLN